MGACVTVTTQHHDRVDQARDRTGGVRTFILAAPHPQKLIGLPFVTPAGPGGRSRALDDVLITLRGSAVGDDFAPQSRRDP
jgi:hypothetical protein